MPVSLTQPLPPYLGPSWHPRHVPERILVRFLESCGGAVDAAELSLVFERHVWLKPAVGNVTVFCDNLSCKYRAIDDYKTRRSPKELIGQRVALLRFLFLFVALPPPSFLR
jgi:hypothetical protein